MISVVIPLYNKAHTIVNTLTTVINQTFKDFEVIIVNDGSTDNGVEVIKSNFNDARIRIINQENAGVSAARNRGVKEAQGDWIAFLDADDEWMPKYLETLLKVLEIHPQTDMIGCASYYKDSKTGKVSANAIIDKYKDKVVHINYFINPDKMTHIGATILSKKAFLQCGGFNSRLKCNEDLLLLGTIAMHGSFIYVGQCLHVYVGNVKGQTTSDKSQETKYLKDKVGVLNQFYCQYIEGNKKNKLVPISIKYRARHLLLLLLKDKRYDLLQIATNQLSPKVYQLIDPLKQISNPKLNTFYILYFYFTKIIWRLHRFPRVGQRSKYNNELIKLYIQS